MSEDREEVHQKPPTKHSLLKSSILASSEGHIFLTGIVMALLYLIWLTLTVFWSPQESQIFITMTVTHIISGRAAGMFSGYAAKLGHTAVIVVNIIIETIVLLIFYPLFVFSWKHLLVIRALRNIMERTHKAAESNRHYIRKYGLLGLFAFVWLPFWMTGSLVGCVIGFLLDLHPWVNVCVVLAGSYIAIGSWAILLRPLHDQIAAFSPYAPMLIVAVILIIALGGYLYRMIRRKYGNHDSPENEHTNI